MGRIQWVPVDNSMKKPLNQGTSAKGPSPAKPLKIPADVWAEAAAMPDAPEADGPELAQSPRELADAAVDRLRKMLRDAETSRMRAVDKLKIEAELRAAVAARAKLVLDEEAILESDAWREIEAELLAAVKALPAKCTRAQVAQALGDAMKGIHARLEAAA
jgi:hypothetical protein